MDDFQAACYADVRDRGYDGAAAQQIAERAARYGHDDEMPRGPWKKRHPDHPVASAANRLQSLEDHAGEYDEDEIADVVAEVATLFDAETFKAVARRFGVTAGSTKGEVAAEVVKRIMAKKEDGDAKS